MYKYTNVYHCDNASMKLAKEVFLAKAMTWHSSGGKVIAQKWIICSPRKSTFLRMLVKHIWSKFKYNFLKINELSSFLPETTSAPTLFCMGCLHHVGQQNTRERCPRFGLPPRLPRRRRRSVDPHRSLSFPSCPIRSFLMTLLTSVTLTVLRNKFTYVRLLGVVTNF